MQLCQCLGVV
ncbi:hypothetical protein OIU77_005555, partial [Salix suchowensis]